MSTDHERIAIAALAQSAIPGTVVIVVINAASQVVPRGGSIAEPTTRWPRAVALSDAAAGERPALAHVLGDRVDVYLSAPETTPPIAVPRA